MLAKKRGGLRKSFRVGILEECPLKTIFMVTAKKKRQKNTVFLMEIGRVALMTLLLLHAAQMLREA